MTRACLLISLCLLCLLAAGCSTGGDSQLPSFSFHLSANSASTGDEVTITSYGIEILPPVYIGLKSQDVTHVDWNPQTAEGALIFEISEDSASGDVLVFTGLGGFEQVA